mmetsp:Transcript_13495/g.22163  ORF Transcript_13495/g.22163 Transcript_13495/m.22163 type:complete len:214 (-) Transcript_13495:103-744(-)
MFGSSGSRTSTGSKVTLNVYDLGPHNNYTHEFGIGTYHSGVQVGGREYTFAGGSGVFFHDPKDVPGEATFRESVELGTYTGTSMALDKILDTLKPQFSEDSYNLVSKNCNHFSDAFVFAMLNVRIPGYVNRLANLGNMVSCLFPPSLLGQAPVGQSGGDSGSNGGSSGYQVSTPMSRRMGGGAGAAPAGSSSSNQVFSRAGFTLGQGEQGMLN